MRSTEICGHAVVRRVPDAEREIYLAPPVVAGGSDVWLVLLSLDALGAESAREELERSSGLTHPAIIRPVDVGRHDGHLVLAFEGVEGTSLWRLMDDLEAHEDQLPDGAVMHLGRALMGALAEAHATRSDERYAPIVHGQLGPHQLLISWDGRVGLIGLGLPAALADAADPSDDDWLTPYLAPEVRAGAQATPQSDVYGAAALLWALLSLRPPLAEGEPRERLRVLRPDLPPSVTFAIDRALEPSPARRISAKVLEVALAKAPQPADREALRWAMETCRARLEDPFPREAFPRSAARFAASPIAGSLPPSSNEPTQTYERAHLLAQARRISTLPWEQGDTPQVPSEPPARPRSARTTVVGLPRRGAASSGPSDLPAPAELAPAAAPSWSSRSDHAEQTEGSPSQSPHDSTRFDRHGSGPPESYAPVSYGSGRPPGLRDSAAPHHVPPSQAPPGSFYPGHPAAIHPASLGAPPSVYVPSLYAPQLSAPPAGDIAAATASVGIRWVAAGAIIALCSFVAGLMLTTFRARVEDALAAPATAEPSTVAPSTAAPSTVAPSTAGASDPPTSLEIASAAPAPAACAAPMEDPPAASSASRSPSPETPPAAGLAGIDPARLPAHEGLLLVSSSFENAHVYVHGRHAGPVGAWLQVPCGPKYVRLGTPPPRSVWLEPGRSFNVACRARTSQPIAYRSARP